MQKEAARCEFFCIFVFKIKNMLKINLPYSVWEYRISGVYKITFSDGFFYIGSSKNLRNRASEWGALFKSDKRLINSEIGSRMMNKIVENKNATFDIIELCSVNDIRDKEAFYLFENMGNSMMLSAVDVGAWRPVLQYNEKNGKFIKKHVSISAAARYVGSNISKIQNVLNGVRKSHKGMKFIYETEYSNLRSYVLKKRNDYNKVERKAGRSIIVFDSNMVEVNRFKKIIDAAKSVSCSPRNVTRVLSGHQKTAGGFIFKYI